MRKPNPLLSILVVLAIVLVAGPVLAESFTVKMKSGESFVTRYRPHAASWDSDMVMLLTDFGHWIALPRADIEIVESDFETRGFGKIINTTTIDLGIAPNDLPAPGEDQSGSTLEQLQTALQGQERSYDVQQFVSPGQAGGGLPVSYGSGIGGGTAVITVTQPAPSGGGGGTGGGGGGGGG